MRAKNVTAYLIACIAVIAIAFSTVGYVQCYNDNRSDGRGVLSTLVDCG